jgi:3-oxo-5-alpha-steroid 4-dehydrogenase 1
MSELELHRGLVWLLFGLAAVTFAALSAVTAPYGRHFRGGWGPSIPARVGWILMESVPVFVFLAIYRRGEDRGELVPLVLLSMWQLHYAHRAFVYPFRMRSRGKRMPLLIFLLAVLFNVLNAYVNARWLSHFAHYTRDWLADPRFLAGAALFGIGMAINLHSDAVLFRLRRPGESGYRIPQGGLYRWVSSPNYLGEIVEWLGWAMATWSLAGLAFAVYTAANLVPRAIVHHRWYRDTFAEYPAGRKAIVPFLL